MNKDCLKIARNITQKYIEEYGMELQELDQLDTMIAEQLDLIKIDSYHEGYHSGFYDGEDKGYKNGYKNGYCDGNSK